MIGSLHTMSYLKPYTWWNKLFAWLKRYQKYSIEEQYEKYNVRAFDIHLYFVGENNKTVFKNGSITYNTFSVYEVLNYLNMQENVYVRIVLEDTSPNKPKLVLAEKESRFYDYCGKIEQLYSNIKFFGGYREFDSKKIYHFKNDCPENVVFYKRVDKLKL